MVQDQAEACDAFRTAHAAQRSKRVWRRVAMAPEPLTSLADSLRARFGFGVSFDGDLWFSGSNACRAVVICLNRGFAMVGRK